MWMQRRKEILMMNSINGSSSSSSSPSWEEKGFSKDLRAAARSPGGCVWPPRSYTCSFCMREFKSAQALGGHMNIHRRDRARLNRYYCLPGIPHNSTEISDIHDNHEYSSLKIDHQINSSPSSSTHDISTFLSPNYSSRVSDEHPFVSSTNFSDHHHDHLSISKVVMLDLEKNPRKLSEDGFVETDLRVGLNISVVGENNRPKTTFSSTSSPSPTGFRGDHHEHETGNYKRPKLMAFFLKPCRLQSNEVTHEVSTTEAAGNSRDDDLDLELRLGEPPKVE